MTSLGKEAALYIHRIMEERRILVASPTEHDASIMTAIVDISDGGDEVVLDYSGSEDVDRLIRQSESIHFSGNIDDANIAFASGAVEDTMYQGRPAFKIKMPRDIHRIQRRDFYRVTPPLSERPECIMEYRGKTYRATVIDISIGGICALVENAGFKPGDVIENCRISMPIGIEVETPLEIAYVGKRLEGRKQVQYGCSFKDVTASLESKLQKYVMYLQSRELAKRRGLDAS